MKKSSVLVCALCVLVLLVGSSFVYFESRSKMPLRDKSKLIFEEGKRTTYSETNLHHANPNSDSVMKDPESNRSELVEEALLMELITSHLGSEGNPAWCQYAQTTRTLNRDSVALLQDLLLDESYRNRWAQIAAMIVWICEKDDDESLNAVVAYIRRADTWDPDKVSQAGAHLFGKAKALGYLGLIQTQSADLILRNAFTEEGSEELIENWSHLTHQRGFDDPKVLAIDIRGYAAKGLILSRHPTNVTIVKDSFESIAHEFLTAEYQAGEFTDEQGYEVMLFTYLTDALVQEEMIADMGLQSFLRIHDTEMGTEHRARFQYKYMGKMREDGRILFESCPICGKSRE